MALRRYSPAIERVREEYARKIAREVMSRRRGPRSVGPKIPDNSEPWIENPQTVGEFWKIAQMVRQRVAEWKRSS